MASPELLTSFYFSVRIAGESNGTDAAFQEVSGLSKETGVEEVVSGGENRFKYRLPNHTSYPNLVLKRGVVMIDSPLVEWCQDTLNGGLGRPIATKDITLRLLDGDGQTSLSWNFIKAYPLKWAMSDLKSQESTMLIETIELAYHYFEADDTRNNQYAGVAAMFGED